FIAAGVRDSFAPLSSCPPSVAPELYPLSLHDALPIYPARDRGREAEQERGEPEARGVGGPHPVEERGQGPPAQEHPAHAEREPRDRKSTRLNSSHVKISYAVFCLKKKSSVGRSIAASR